MTIFPEDVAKAKKIELLARADDAARSAGAAVTQVSAGYGDSRRRILVANSDGVLVSDDQVRSRFSVQCVAVGDTGMQTGYETAAFTVGFELFDTVEVEKVAGEAARRALAKLSARPAPSGEVPIVLASGSGGILFHEACGHGLEADHIAKDASVYAGQMGAQVASPLVTLVDDGTIGPRVGDLLHRRRGARGPAQCPHRERDPDRVHVGLPAGPPGGAALVGQRAPAELPRPAHGADDQHLPHRRRRRSRGAAGPDPDAVSTWPSSAADRSTPPPGTSCSERWRPT